MPLYEYKCQCCSHEVEELQGINDPPLSECPRCKVCALKRQISGGTSFRLVGSGWAADGYGGGEGQ